MEKICIAVIGLLIFSIFSVNEASAISPAMDWDWYFTEVWDDGGNLLARDDSPGSDPLIFDIAPDIFKLRIYGAIFNRQELNSTNIDFVNTHTFAEKMGGGAAGFNEVYGMQISSPGKIDRLLPLAPGEHGPFWFLDVYLKDANSPAPAGTYRVYDSGLDIYDLEEPLNEFGNHTIYGIDVSNEVLWNVRTAQAVPEPGTFILSTLGIIAAALIRRRQKA